jgi:hypothetical protein
MPRRWERALSNVPRLTEPDRLWREAAERAAHEDRPDPFPPRRQRLVAGVVAVGVFLAAGLFVWQAFEGAGPRPPAGDDPAPTAPGPRGSFASLTFARPAPGAESPVPSATLGFGDFVAHLKATDTSFVNQFVTTSELPGSSLGLPAGLPMRMEGDAVAGSVKVYASYPFDRDPISAYDLREGPAFLPDRPGTYFLSVRGEWADGWTTYLWGIPVVRSETLQIALDDHGRTGEGAAELWVGGRRVTGAVVERGQMIGDVGMGHPIPPVQFRADDYVEIEAGAPIRLLGEATELSAALTGPRWEEASDPGVTVPLFGPRVGVPAEPGHHLLVLDAAWQEGRIGYGQNGYREDVRFAFPVDVVGSSSVPPPAPLPSGPVVVTFDTSEAGKIPDAFATFGDRKFPAVMNRYRFTIDGEVFESSNQHRDAAMVGAATIPVPPGARIEFEGDQDRVLAGWGGDALAPAPSLSVQGSTGHTVALRFRGEWGPDSFVEWELFFEVQAP